LRLLDLCLDRAKISYLTFLVSSVGRCFILYPRAFLCPLSFVHHLLSLVSFPHDRALLPHACAPLSPGYFSDSLFLWLWGLVLLFSSSPFAPVICEGSHYKVAHTTKVVSPCWDLAVEVCMTWGIGTEYFRGVWSRSEGSSQGVRV
jgi:hypothetical protein